jgi:hypothetical protein
MSVQQVALAAARTTETTATLQRIGVVAVAVIVFAVVFELVRRQMHCSRPVSCS